MAIVKYQPYQQVIVLVVLLERIELSTSPLPRECSTSELQQHRRFAECSPDQGQEAMLVVAPLALIDLTLSKGALNY